MENEHEKRPVPYRMIVCIAAVAVVLAIYVVRLVDWQVINGDTWVQKADYSTQTTVPMPASRGEILDSGGNPLAVNNTGYAIVFDWVYMKQSTNEETQRVENQTILRLIRLVEEKGGEWEDVLPVEYKDGGYVFKDGEDKEISTLKGKDYADVNAYATADLCMENLIKKYSVDSGYTPEEMRDIVSVRYNMTKNQFGVSAPYTFAQDVSDEVVAIVSENSQVLPGVSVQITTAREYAEPDLIPHIVGYLGKISEADDFDALEEKGYSYDDILGKGGIELAYEDQLRGKAGEKLIETTNTGALAGETVLKAPEAGNTIFLTINNRLQEVANASLAKNIQDTRAYGEHLCEINKDGRSEHHGEDCIAGGAVLMDVKTGAVLAAATYPTYNIQQFLDDSDYRSQLNTDNVNRPLLNRAFSGTFTPGSCFKPVIACAALEEHTITTATEVYCNHYYTRFTNGSTTNAPTCLGWHGVTNLNKAIAQSCNVYFFETGFQLGISNIDLYARRFGLGELTGIEIGESAGTLAGPESRAEAMKNNKNLNAWTAGETLNAAIGQSDNSFTPLQLCAYAATLANDGKRLKATIISKITDYTRSEVLYELEPTVLNEVGVSQENLSAVREGMKAVITEGSARATLSDYPVQIAGKTGTAETGGSDNVTFIGYAPADDPQVAIAVVLEHGATSSYCQYVVRDMLDAYFFGKAVDEDGNIYTPSGDAGGGDGTASGTSSGSSSGSGGE